MNPQSVLIVGGGTAGLISSIILKKRLDIKVDVVYSKSVGIIGVGEGSTKEFKEFMKFVGIKEKEIIQNCDATLKIGILFDNWAEKPYLHTVEGPYDLIYSQYWHLYAKMISENHEHLHSPYLLDNLINEYWLHEQDDTKTYANQYHFNTYKLNDFLVSLAKSLGINIIEDDINDVVLKENGEINFLDGNRQEYRYDFYIDATGFKRILMNKLGAKWKSFGKYLKMNSAIVFPTEDEENYNIWTLAKAMDYGWLFRIPVWGRYGNGYIFSDRYTDIDNAKQELEILYKKEIDIGKKFNFDPGCLENVWIKNCCAIGLSGSFVEPLEASSIGTSIQQTFLLMHRLPNYNENSIKAYNKSFSDIMENIRDFIVLHYLTKKTNTQFWKDVSEIELPDTLETMLEQFKRKLPIKDDFNHLTSYILFNSENYLHVMHGLDLFDKQSISNEYALLNSEWKKIGQQVIEEKNDYDSKINLITHKQFIDRIRKRK
jgi:flavin-dependent dehydrogenase